MGRYMATMFFPKISEYIGAHKGMAHLMNFSADNPTGHYKLNLGNCSDFAVGEQLMLLDRWEMAIDRQRGRADISQRGNRSHVRNEMYEGRALHLHYDTLAEWNLPDRNELELDYSSSCRPPLDATPLSSAPFESLSQALHESETEPEHKILILRNVAEKIYITSMQMRQLLGYFKCEEHRADVYVAFFMRITDIYNSKLFRVRFEKQREVENLMHRLGYVTSFPFIQPENGSYSLNLESYEQRLCTSILVHLAWKEKLTNLRGLSWQHSNGVMDVFPNGVPKSWESVEKVGKEGTFKAKYVCAPEDRKFEVRRHLSQMYTYFNVAVQEKDVQCGLGSQRRPATCWNFWSTSFVTSRLPRRPSRSSTAPPTVIAQTASSPGSSSRMASKR